MQELLSIHQLKKKVNENKNLPPDLDHIRTRGAAHCLHSPEVISALPEPFLILEGSLFFQQKDQP